MFSYDLSTVFQSRYFIEHLSKAASKGKAYKPKVKINGHTIFFIQKETPTQVFSSIFFKNVLNTFGK